MTQHPFGDFEHMLPGQVPQEPSAQARGFSRFCWDNYSALLNEGFTQGQAMSVLLTLLQNAKHNTSSPEGGA